jgi:hypothetical protein
MLMKINLLKILHCLVTLSPWHNNKTKHNFGNSYYSVVPLKYELKYCKSGIDVDIRPKSHGHMSQSQIRGRDF